MSDIKDVNLPVTDEAILKKKREKILNTVEKLLQHNNIQYTISSSSKKKFINKEINEFGDYSIVISLSRVKYENLGKICSALNKKLIDMNAKVTRDNYGTIFLSYIDNKRLEEADTFELPNEKNIKYADSKSLLDNTDPKKIYLSSDWHFFKNHYKHEANYVNTQKIVAWCKQNIKPDDVFMYLGDISFRYANAKDQAESQRLLASIPGRKILILGNHDRMLGEDYYTGCGFEFVMEDLEWHNYVFTHRPINMSTYPDDYINIHGHIHNIRTYNTTDGKRNVNVYPYFYDNKPVTLDYIVKHFDELVKDNEWNPNSGYGEQVYVAVPKDSVDKLELLSKINEASIHEQTSNLKPTVYFSQDINSYNIAYMVGLFKNKLNGRIGIKLHCGEEGNQNYLKPSLLKDLVNMTHGTFIDSNVAYKSIRQTSEGHRKVAEDHGFTKYAYFDILDADGDISIAVPYQNKILKELEKMKSEGINYVSPITQGPHLTEVSIGSRLSAYDSMVVYTHFKGHAMAGYGGAVKNIGMGIPSGKVGKLQVHGKEFKKGPEFLERLVEAAVAVEDYFEGNIVYVNVLKNLSVDCDCDHDSAKPTMKDIGVLVSDNLYAIEQASLDFIRKAPDNKDLIERIASRGGMHQIEYMKFLGIGTNGYILKDMNNEKLVLESNKESNINENVFRNVDDILYNYDKLKEGKTNLCFITGQSGSGKSTMAANFVANNSNSEYIGLDEVLWNADAYSLEWFKIYSPAAYEFFTGPGKRYFLQSNSPRMQEFYDEFKRSGNKYEYLLTTDFVKFIIDYAKKHPKKLFFVEGIHIYIHIIPKDIDKYAVFIKGTSAFNSFFRAYKRDHQSIIEKLDMVGMWKRGETALKIYRDYFSAKTKYSIHEQYKSNKQILNGFTSQDIQEKVFNKLPENNKDHGDTHRNYEEVIYRDLQSINKNGEEYYGFIEMYETKESSPKLRIASVAIHLHPDCRGTGLSDALVKKAITNMKPLGIDRIEWYCKKSNTASYHLAKRCGFKVDTKYCTDDWLTLYYGKSIIQEQLKRSELPDSAFGIPEDRKFPLDTEKHIRSAIKLFGHAEENKKKSLAKRIKAAADKYSIEIPETTKVYQYLNEGGIEDVIPSEVDTVIFDFGDVLISSRTHETLMEGLAGDDDLIHLISDFVTDEFFPKFYDDMRDLSLEEVKQLFIDNAPPHVAEYVDEVFELIPQAIYVHSYVDELIFSLRAKGYSLYYLSNWPIWAYELEQHIFADLTAKFDGGVFDHEYAYSKPDHNIYEILINKYKLTPEHCIFFDDNAENVLAAQHCGMHARIFNLDLLKELMQNNFSAPSEYENEIIIDTGLQLEAVNTANIKYWYCSNNRNAPAIPEYCYKPTLDMAIKMCYGNGGLANGIPEAKYVFIKPEFSDIDGNYQPQNIGQIYVYPNGQFKWIIQYPIKYNDIDGYTSGINEWSMASVNPIIGVSKPFILKIGSSGSADSGDLIDPKRYALSPDIISDKYLIINEDSKLEVVNASYFKDCPIEVYEYIGNYSMLHKLNEIYKSGKIVDNSVFYTTLTGKPMLTEDQIDFDSNFVKVDFDAIVEGIATELATMRDKYLEASGLGATWANVLESEYYNKIDFLNKYSDYTDICIKEDYDGFFFYSDLTKKRSGSVGSSRLLTEAMLKSIL